ncbi:DUF6491 family protein [Terricaulis sp.]|uniref:DUF6491 family protein n=1 Tax=Terricaulis sp. TaxID=2768686 RepID=UPI0037847790
MLRMTLLAAAAALSLGACASTETADNGSSGGGNRDCFRSLDVSGYGVIDESHIRVSVGANRHYSLGIRQNTRDLDWTHAIAIRSTTSFICTGNGLGVQLVGGDPALTYPVTSIERLPDPPVTGS